MPEFPASLHLLLMESFIIFELLPPPFPSPNLPLIGPEDGIPAAAEKLLGMHHSSPHPIPTHRGTTNCGLHAVTIKMQ